ncbi:heterocyst specific ABC-transporter, membrane fusion protein DevB homolog [Calothrix sp. PCC 7716]|nr:heterocyst specific ABC-transporter, membrane fusion protein DevB homolog [Calothrix sp. PCC 7716]
MDIPSKTKQLKQTKRWITVLVISAGITTIIGSIYIISRYRFLPLTSTPTPSPTVSIARTVTAIGRLEPKGEAVHAATTSSLEGTRILQILVKQGDKVKTGQVLAVLDIRDRRLAALKEASEQVKVAQARLAQVKAGAKAGEINAQEATVSRLEAQLRGEVATQQATVDRLKAQLRGDIATQQETISRLESQLSNAQTEYQRYEQLYRSGAISASNLDSKRLAVDTVRDQVNEAKAALNKIRETLEQQIKEAQETLNKTKATLPQQINEAKANLNSIAEVRPTDVQAAQAEVDKATAAVVKAKADLEVAYVKAPKDGRILKIHTRSGEAVSNQGDGILKLGQTDQMYAVAEVYETDISKVRLGQTATITSDAFPEKLQGKVDQIGWEVAKKDVLSTDPAAATDVRVVEVKIALDQVSSQQVAALTNMQVTVEIQP